MVLLVLLVQLFRKPYHERGPCMAFLCLKTKFDISPRLQEASSQSLSNKTKLVTQQAVEEIIAQYCAIIVP